MKPAKTMVFFGAGASRPFGYRVTSELLPDALLGLNACKLFSGLNSNEQEMEDMIFLRTALSRLLPGWRPDFPPQNVPLITEILSLVDYSIGEGKPLLANQSQDDVLRVRHLLERAIYELLRNGGTKGRDLLDRFVDWIKARYASGSGVVTTNYDICLEQKLFAGADDVHARFDFGFSWLDVTTNNREVRMRPQAPWLRWFKLHGSLNWVRCPVCEHLYINPYGKIAHQTFRTDVDNNNTCYCGRNTRLQLHLVAPSMYRTVRDANLLEVWKNTMQLLLEADEWILLGYSLPSEDIAIRSMLVRAFSARPYSPPKVTVVQHGTEAESRYKLLFPQCHYHAGGLETWLKQHP